jgi:light-regulated signal transduction histidine kinase (bacteriophytochrome)
MSSYENDRLSPAASNAQASGYEDRTSCDLEQIHLPGSVQPHGALLALDPLALSIEQAGGDTAGLLGALPAAILGQRMEAWFPADCVARLRSLLTTEGPLSRPLFAFRLAGQQDRPAIDVIAHQTSGFVVLELEPLHESETDDQLGLMQTMLLRVRQAETSATLCQGFADEMRRVSGFDRVVVYRFLADGSGVVDAEARDPAVAGFRGLHFPASDIPRQARDLYLNNWLRLIPDARYRPAPIVPPVSPRDGRALDLSHSLLRSVSPTHLEYLANMGVVASMSLSIIIGGRLWGLIACHHRSARFLPYHLRLTFELFAQMASYRLETQVAAEGFDAQLRSKQVHEELLKSMSREADLADGLTRHWPNLLDYIAADGVGLWLDGSYTRLGRTPTADQVAGLVGWLNEHVADGVFSTDRLPLVYPPATAFADVASGVIALSVSRGPRDYVLWFRPEEIRTVVWAGNPNKRSEAEAVGALMTPRTSFAAWREALRWHARPWQALEVDAARALRVSLLEVVLLRIDQISRERETARAEQAALSAELDRRLEQWRAVAAQLKQEAARRGVLEANLSQMVRTTMEDQEAERSRIARELHDTLGQTLTLLQLGLDGLSHRVSAGQDVQGELAGLKGLTTQIGSEVNRLAWEIRPTALDDLGLETAIRHLTENWGERSQLRFDLHLALHDRRLDPAVETTLYRVLQEAIINIIRHAGATRVGVLLERYEGGVRMIVEDDGRGFKSGNGGPAAGPAKRLGLLGIRERLSLVSGSLEIESSPGHGCTLFVSVPA